MPSSNPFRSIIPIPRADKLFSMARNNVMKTSIRGTSESVPLLRRIRKKEATRIELLSKELRTRLFRIVEEFPSLEAESITGFYVEILDLSFNLDKIRKTLGSFSGAADVIWKIKREYLGDVWHANSVIEAKRLRRAAFGRMNSVITKLDSRLEFLETVRGRMRGMPGIDLEQPTICIAGYPNVGKSSLVTAVTAATPEIGAYPFTTKEVTLGHLKIPVYASANSDRPINYISTQIVDTPGILDRTIEERNEIELRAIAALKTLATAILFIFDFTQIDSIISQKNLFDQISQNFQEIPTLLMCSKADLISENQKTELHNFLEHNFTQSNVQILSMHDKEGIKKLLFDFYEEYHSQIQIIMNKRKIGESE
jgi:nucleolar GTP-binding protein